MKQVTVRVPATSANIGPGFDCFGVALGLYNEFSFNSNSSLKLKVMGEGADKIPADETNLVARSAHFLWCKRMGAVMPAELPFAITQRNEIPVGSGLGSSSSAVLGGLLGANAFLPQPFTQTELLAMATELEGHPDNVVPAFYGGFCLMVADESLTVVQIESQIRELVVVLPAFEFPTVQARQLLPATVPLSDAVFNVSRLALLINTLQKGNWDELRVAIRDKLHQPTRIPLIPGAKLAIARAERAGGVVALSGAGPSLIAFTPEGNAGNIAEIIKGAFAEAGLASRSWVLGVDNAGIQIERVH